MGHRLLVMGAVGRERVARGVERFAEGGDIAMAENREDALEQPLLPPVDFDALGAQEADHRLGGCQPDRCHGTDFLYSILQACRARGGRNARKTSGR
jgi:hypothetical protein